MQVPVLNSNWIQNIELSREIKQPGLQPNALVADFIDGDNQWREDMVTHYFSSEAAERILRTPLPRNPRQDALIWQFDKHGNYSVKSGHQVAVRLKFPGLPSCSDISKTQWRVIWAADIPEKMKIFMWRAAQNMLPTANNLWKKKMVRTPVCQRCCCKSEDAFHALMEYKDARQVWKLTEFHEDIKRMAHQDMLSVLQELAKKRKKKDVEQIIAICWAVWYARNCFVIEGKKEDPTVTAARAGAVVESYRRIKSPSAQGLTSHKNSQQNWEPPPADRFKVNVDAAIQVSQSQAGLGVVIKNSKG